MSFTERALRFTFSGDKTGALSVSGLRAVASIQVFQGRLGAAAQIKIWGLSMSQMNTYSAALDSRGSYQSYQLTVEAGDVGGTLHKVLDKATIWRSYPDLTDVPESAFNITVAGSIYDATRTIAPQSQAGAQNAEDLISSVCASAGMTFHNPQNAHAVLRNHSTYGSPVTQIENIANAARFSLYIEGNNVWIWPYGQGRDGIVIDSLPNQRVGYPVFWESGIIVQTEFDQRIQVGRQMRVTSSIPKANGLWQITQANHDLSTMLEKGPWFSTAVLSPIGS